MIAESSVLSRALDGVIHEIQLYGLTVIEHLEGVESFADVVTHSQHVVLFSLAACSEASVGDRDFLNRLFVVVYDD